MLSALLDVFDNIMQMLDNNPSVDMVYLEFSKAFDKVDHGILLHKLRSLGISGNIGIWLYHFLTNRSHFVQLPEAISKDHPVISGVPQGTVLSPILFLIMIADIDKDVSASNLISLADDTRLYSGVGDVTDCDNLQFDLDTRRKHNMKFRQIVHTTSQYGQSFFLKLLVHGTGLLSLKLCHSDSDSIFRRTLLGYYAEGMHANFLF